MASVLVVAVICRLAMNFRGQDLGPFWTAVMCGPTVIVLVLLAVLLRNRVGVLTLALCGALVALPWLPGGVWLPWDGWQAFLGYYLHTAIPPALSALVIGGPVAFGDAWNRRNPNDCSSSV